MIRGSARIALNAALRSFEEVLDAAGNVSLRLGDQLFDVTELLDQTGALRRALTDPGRSADDKAAFVHRLFDGHCDPRVAGLVSGLARTRWSKERDLADALEKFAFSAILSVAQASGSLDRVEEELFRIDRILVGQRALRTALGDRRVPPEQRAALISRLVHGKVDPITEDLVRRVVGYPRGRTLSASLAMLGRFCAERRHRILAAVTSPVELNPTQQARLGQLIEDAYGSEVQLDVSIDPTVVGGLRIQVGDDVVDGTVLAKIAAARRELVSN